MSAAWPPARAKAIYEQLGHFLARLSVLDAQTIPTAQDSADRSYHYLDYNRATYREVLRRHARCTPRLMELFESGFDLQYDMTGFAHWDGAQVVADEKDRFAVIDWGIAEIGNRLFDLGMFLMLHGFWVEQWKGLPLYPGWRAAVLRGYLGGRLLTETMRRQIHLIGMAFCLREAMSRAESGDPKADDFLTFLETEDAAFEAIL